MELFGRQYIVVAIDAKSNYNVPTGNNVFSEENKKFCFEVFIYGAKKETA